VPAGYGSCQVAALLGLEPWQLGRLCAAGQVPAADLPGDRWSAAAATGLLPRVAELRAAAGTMPDLGACRAAEVLTARLGTEVTADGVEELARRGLVPAVGWYKGHRLYSGLALGSFTDTAAAEAAVRAGELLTAARARARLRIRVSDWDHLIRGRMLRPVKRVHGPWDRRRGAPTVRLFRAGDLDVLLARPDIDWAAVRAAPRGQRSPLARVAGDELTMLALASIGTGKPRARVSRLPGVSRLPPARCVLQGSVRYHVRVPQRWRSPAARDLAAQVRAAGGTAERTGIGQIRITGPGGSLVIQEPGGETRRDLRPGPSSREAQIRETTGLQLPGRQPPPAGRRPGPAPQAPARGTGPSPGGTPAPRSGSSPTATAGPGSRPATTPPAASPAKATFTGTIRPAPGKPYPRARRIQARQQ
jgi:hypothetical protein